MQKYQSQKNRFIGIAPTNIKEEDLMDYFLYIFEFVWSSPIFDEHRGDLGKYFEKHLAEITEKNVNLSFQKKWWALVLIALRDISDAEDFLFSIETINFILKSIQSLKEEELEEYANNINHTLYEQMPDVLAIRPLELDTLKSDAVKDDDVLMYLLGKEAQIVKIISKSLKQKDINIDYLCEVLLNNKKITSKFSTFWRAYYESFIGYSLSIFSILSDNIETVRGQAQIVEALKQSNLMFFTSSIFEKEKAEKVNNEIFNVLKSFYEEKFK